VDEALVPHGESGHEYREHPARFGSLGKSVGQKYDGEEENVVIAAILRCEFVEDEDCGPPNKPA
jgi:hypothetical protein